MSEEVPSFNEKELKTVKGQRFFTRVPLKGFSPSRKIEADVGRSEAPRGRSISFLLGQFHFKLLYCEKCRQNFAPNVTLYPCERSCQNHLGIKRKRTENCEGHIPATCRKVSKCLQKKQKFDMGAGCGKNSGKNVISPVQSRTIQASPTAKDRAKRNPTAPLTDQTNISEVKDRDILDEKAKDDPGKPKRKSFEVIVHDVKKKEEENVTKSVGSFRRASSIEPVIVGVKPKDSITEESHLYGSKSTGDLHDSPTSGLTGLNLSRSCSCENASSLRHYGGSANLLDFDSVRSSSLKADPRHGKARSASCTEAGHKLPPLPPRYKRQPTIENSVCFQEEDQVNSYQICDEIGRGSYGSVYKCFCLKDNQYYAMKVISKRRLIKKNGLMARHPRRGRNNPLDGLHKEIAILKKVDHPNVVKMIEVIDDPEVDNVYMVFEIMERGPVLEIPTDDPLTEDQAWQYFRDMLLGIEYLHYTRIIHRDIKPSNLLLGNENRVKIADFGVSDIFEGEDDTLNRFAGSPAFQAPEAIAGNRSKFSGKAADVWAMGVTLYSLVYGKCPFLDKDILKLYEMIQTEPVLFPDELAVNPQLQDLISRMLAKDPKQRVTVSAIKEHPWVTKGGKDILPSTEQHCNVIEVSEEDLRNSVTLISRLSSLVLVKSMLRRRGFGSSKRKRPTKQRSNSTPDVSQNIQNTIRNMKNSNSTGHSKMA